jgi:hypothetical protein
LVLPGKLFTWQMLEDATFQDFRDFGLIGCDRTRSEADHLNDIRYRLLPEETKNLLTLIRNQERCNLCQVDFQEITSWRGLFSWEFSATGTRSFFVIDYKFLFPVFSFLREYHLYETIPENRPCHLYFDCEFLFGDHPDFDGPKMIEDLINLVDDRLFTVFGHEECEVINLDATTPKKFSRHLIFRSDEFCFRNNNHVRRFIETEILPAGNLAEIIDMAVYTKNRNFRCIWSTKVANGTNYPLKPVDATNSSPSESSLAYFQKTLIAFVGDNPHCVEYGAIEPPEPASKPIEKPFSHRVSGHDDIDRFALSVFAPSGRISNRKYNCCGNILNLIVDGNRFCRRIGREHRSNHIFIACRLSRGDMVQKCTDPDCRGFESDPVPIPERILELLHAQYIPADISTSVTIKQPSLKSIDFKSILGDIEKSLEEPDPPEFRVRL